MRNLQEIMGFLLKNSVTFKSICFNNDRVIAHNTAKCVKNCSGDQLSYICSSNYYKFFCNLDYNSENSVFLGQIRDKLSCYRPCA